MRAIFIGVIVISISTNLYASESANKLMLNYIEATGGESALMQMKSISRYGKIKFYDTNKTYCYKTDIIYPTKLREQIKSDEILLDRGTDGVSSWSWLDNKYEFTNDKKLKQYLSNTAKRANRDMLYVLEESKGFDVMAHSPSWAPINAQCIQPINPNDLNHIYCFDRRSGLLSAIGNSNGDNHEYRLEKDWRQVGTIKIPFVITHYYEGKVGYEVSLESAIFNNSISATQFLKPHKTTRPSCE